jgi:4-hydroxy 2-oxovalerate aldolase
MLYDVTLRDGNHALRHQLSPGFVAKYSLIADKAGVYALEVGHGNGLGASSFLVGKSAFSDSELISAARNGLRETKLSVHCIPGFATIERDLKPAIALGVDIFRVATHVTEANVAETQISFLKDAGLEVQGVLMMTHMAETAQLIEQALIHEASGADAIVIMDSAGYYRPDDVLKRISELRNRLSVPIGFHAHNNLGLAISNALAAQQAGASILDGSSMGLGAGAGNAQLENLAANSLPNRGDLSSLTHFFDLSRLVESSFPDFLPIVSSASIESGLSGVFSGYAPQVKQVASEFGIDSSTLWREIARRKLVAGQESMIREIAQDLMNL